MQKHSFISKMPDQPGALHKAAKIIKKHNANINRIQFDREIDSSIVFFEITTDTLGFEKIMQELEKIGYLQSSLEGRGFLKFNVHLPNKPGSLLEFLDYTTNTEANIGFMDFDDRGQHPDTLTISLTLDDASVVDNLLDQLKSRYSLEVIEYDATGKHLDDTVFYLKFAQKLRGVLGDDQEEFLLKLMHDVSHFVQELNNLGEDPKKVFESILRTGEALSNSSGSGFYADIQEIKVSDEVTLYCFQMPCGGNIYLLASDDELALIDAGFGLYYEDFKKMISSLGFNIDKINNIYITHADADHLGAAGFFQADAWMHPDSLNVLEKTNRAYGSTKEGFVLTELYTRLIGLFSGMISARDYKLFKVGDLGSKHGLKIIDFFKFKNLEFEVFEGLGGHLAGQVFFFCEEHKLLFTGDSVINFDSLSDERKQFNLHAKVLMKSVNVDSANACKERDALLKLGEKCFFCCGHGAVSTLEGDKLKISGEVRRFIF